MISVHEAYAFMESYGLPAAYNPPPKFTPPRVILAEGIRRMLSTPGYCEACQVWGAPQETECWNCGTYYSARRSAPGPAASVTTGPCSPTWRQVIGLDPYEDTPEESRNGTSATKARNAATIQVHEAPDLYHPSGFGFWQAD